MRRQLEYESPFEPLLPRKVAWFGKHADRAFRRWHPYFERSLHGGRSALGDLYSRIQSLWM